MASVFSFLPTRLGELDQPLGRVGPAVEQHVLDALEQVLGDLLVDLELAGVDDAHVEAGADGVVEEGRVHRLADRPRCRGSENETLLTPPEVFACGNSCFSSRTASMNSTA